jgi:ferredoxin
MPWVKKEECVGCGICVDKCPVGSITLRDGVAFIDMTSCIHCGVCHTACPRGAVEHDSEKIPEEVRANVAKTKGFMEACAKHLGEEKEKKKCLNRMIKHFNKEKIVLEKTLEKLQILIKNYDT